MELWFTERHTKAAGLTLKIKRTLCSLTSRYQKIDVLETEEFGRMLLLDGLVMTTERDEFIYHEMLVHPPMHFCKGAKRVAIIGGGDGGAVREVLRYQSVEKVILCEIDEKVIEVSKRYFPQLSCGFEDPRVEIVCMDGFEFLRQTQKAFFDVILVDSTDPIGAATALFTNEFYVLCHRALNESGLITAQSESPFYHEKIIREMKENLLRAGFLKVAFYTAPIPTYPGGYWSWTIAFKNKELSSEVQFQQKAFYEHLKYFNKGILEAAFKLPNFFKKAVC